MNIFSNYKNIIEKALDRNDLSKAMNESQGLGYPNYSYEMKTFSNDKTELSLSSLNDLQNLTSKLDVIPIQNQQVGHHPDFRHLKGTNNTEKHYILSVFIDVRKSTNLFKRYNEETIYMITNTVQLAAIAVCSVFGGFIHRLQGDGVFIYFGRKGLSEKKATEHALIALSLFTYFIKTDLKKIFEDREIETIHTTIGADLGFDKDVLWAMAGVDNMSEVTTYSLHTSLASKMQGFAKANQIILGDNVKDIIELDSDLFEIVPDKRYIFENQSKNFYYTQYIFKWMKYLKGLNYIATSNTGKIELIPQVSSSIGIINSDSIKKIASANKPYYKNEV